MYDEGGEQVWERSLDLNGKVINGSNAPCPFLYQGQYYDKEIELAYNRFRYYDPDDGRYISKDPIGLLSGEYGFYNYVGDPNTYTDILGLSKSYARGKKKLDKYRKNGSLDEASNGHLDKHGMSKDRMKEVLDDPDAVLYHNNNTNLVFHKDGDVVVVNTKENKLITSYGASDMDGNAVNLSNLQNRNALIQIE
ncbi:RHS repeat-associated core domain-containing protein [Tenacibaculum maritimum]|uniref:RHS repeat domain-containing protein n=1 Tax=Tenacibaculum maritimum TaxID=107401 RepID=UPI0012E457F6|nr:RHS repeat-associated core domain-containing protein [Tenacibaculum maritimum]CAA0149816.1 conserved hypothetical protein [Tenacibaculum maritimum]